MTVGLLLIVLFFLPWVARTEGCADDAAIVRDNISGYSLAVEGTATGVVAAPISGLVIGLLALFLVGRTRPFARSLASLGEILPLLWTWIFVDFEVLLLIPYIPRFGYTITFVLMGAVPALSFIESAVHLPLMNRTKRLIASIIIAAAVTFLVVTTVYDALT